MKALQKTIITFVLILSCSGIATASGWTTNLESALASAKKNKKFVLAQFTGSDWCPPCMMIHDKVFSKSAFTGPVSRKFILVKIDMPKSDPKLTEKNRKVMRAYKVTGVPTVLLFGDDGREFSRFGAAAYPTVDGFIDKLREELKKKETD